MKPDVVNIAVQKEEKEVTEMINIEQERYEELIKKEAQFEFIKKLLASKTSYNSYADVSDLLLLLDIKKEQV